LVGRQEVVADRAAQTEGAGVVSAGIRAFGAGEGNVAEPGDGAGEVVAEGQDAPVVGDAGVADDGAALAFLVGGELVEQGGLTVPAGGGDQRELRVQAVGEVRPVEEAWSGGRPRRRGGVRPVFCARLSVDL